MAVISFRVFKGKILDGTKRQTIRPTRKYPIKVGDRLRLWWKQRTPDREFLGETTCIEVIPIQIPPELRAIKLDGNPISHEDRVEIAIADGFDSLEDFFAYFSQESKGQVFNGNLIKWGAPKEFGSLVICALRYLANLANADAPEHSYWNPVAELVLNSWRCWMSEKDRAVVQKDLSSPLFANIRPIQVGNCRQLLAELVMTKSDFRLFPQPELERFGGVVICALRYCFGRMTYMPSLIVDAVKSNWALISESDRAIIKADVERAFAINNLGMDCDIKMWQSFRDWLSSH